MDPSPRTKRLCVAILLLFTLAMAGCADVRGFLAKSVPLAGYPPDSIAYNDFEVTQGDDVVGELATVRLAKGDTLPDVARHFGLGLNTVNAANPGVDTWVPAAGERILLPLAFILPDARRSGVVINLAAMRLFCFNQNGDVLRVSTYPVGIGTEERPTPLGKWHVTRKKHLPTWYVPASIAADHRKRGDILPAQVPPGPLNPLGDYALYLSAPGYLMHGTNKPASIGLRASNGCIRLYPENIERLFKKTAVKTPVNIVNQPYLVGWRNGIVYLEAHTPFDESGTANWKKVYAKLQRYEKKSGNTLDWHKVKEVVLEARGYPVPVSAVPTGREMDVADAIPLRHPDTLYGRPDLPEFKKDAWYLEAANLRDPVDAQRLAAIINHQGPPIPARVLTKNNRHRVVAGPFEKKSEAKEAANRLKFDLELDANLFEI